MSDELARLRAMRAAVEAAYRDRSTPPECALVLAKICEPLHLDQAWVTKVTQSSDPELAVMGAPPLVDWNAKATSYLDASRLTDASDTQIAAWVRRNAESFERVNGFKPDAMVLTAKAREVGAPPSTAPSQEGLVTRLVTASLAYDAAIQRHAAAGSSWVGGDDLDALYAEWIGAARALQEAPPSSAGAPLSPRHKTMSEKVNAFYESAKRLEQLSYGKRSTDEATAQRFDEFEARVAGAVIPPDTSAITRLEVIGPEGRIYSKRNTRIELAVQDEGRTLKVWVK
jgi:hypothetical protein